jgi:hypothetical protein
MITLADRIREAREGQAPQGHGMGLMAMGEATADPLADLPPEIASRIPPPRGPVNPGNPAARCDYCPRVQAADMLVEVAPGRYACDGCMSLRPARGAEDHVPVAQTEAGSG